MQMKNCLKELVSIISCPEVFFNNDVLENLADFVGKHICRNLFSNRPATFWKKKTTAQYFSHEFCEIFKSALFTEHFRTTASEYRNICQEHLDLNARRMGATIFWSLTSTF